MIQNGQLELKKIFDSVLYHALDQMSIFKTKVESNLFDRNLRPVSFLSRVNDRGHSTFSELYALVEGAKCIC